MMLLELRCMYACQLVHCQLPIPTTSVHTFNLAAPGLTLYGQKSEFWLNFVVLWRMLSAIALGHPVPLLLDAV